MNKIVEGLKDAIRYAKGELVQARVTRYPGVQEGCGCVWCDLDLKPAADGKHHNRHGAFPCTRK